MNTESMTNHSQIITNSVVSGNTLKMTSREVAELTGKQHGHVMRDIRAYMGAVLQMERGIDVKSLDWSGHEGAQVFGDTPIGGVTYSEEINPQNGQPYPIYHLDKSATLTIVSGYNVLLRKKIIDRWQELEEQRSPVPQTLPEALRLAADMAEQKAALELKVQADAPKVSFVDHYVDAAGSKSLRATAKVLNMPERAMIDALIRDKVLFRQSGNLLPYASHHHSGNFTVKTGTAEQSGHAFTQTRVTPRGIQWIAERYASELMAS